jgi:type I restriction enzyme S subunit
MSTVRLRHLAQVNPPCPVFDSLSADDELTFMPMEAVWPGERLDVSRVRSKAAVATGYTRFQEGDVLVPKITPTFEAGRAVLIHGLRNGVGAGTTELHVLRAGPLIDPRFLFYLVNTHRFLKLGEAEMYGVAGQQRVPDDFLRDLPVTLFSLDEQSRIADFLDRETARIDRLVDIRTRQRAVIDVRRRVATEKFLAQCESGELTRVKYLLRARPRYGVLVPVFSGEGIPFIRVNDLLDLQGRARELARIPASLSSQYARTVVKPKDVLVSVVGTLGRATTVPDELVGANIARAVCSLRLRPEVDPQLFVAWVATSEFERQALLATGTDSAQPTLGMEDLSNFSVRWPSDLREQEKVAGQVRESEFNHIELLERTGRQIALLAERRQALITAAVTGQLDVTTARPAYDRGL